MYKKFQELLEKKNVTAYRVSKDTGVPQSTLSDWKRGISQPKTDKLIRLAKYFNIPVTEFFEEQK